MKALINIIKSGFRGMASGHKFEVVLTLLCGIAIVVGFTGRITGLLDHNTERLFYIFAYLTGGYHGFVESIKYLLRRKLNIDVLMILAAIGAAIIDSWLEGAILLFLFSFSHSLQHFAMNKSRNAIREIMKLRPDKALLVEEDGIEKTVPVESLQKGNIIIVKPGERIPIDGMVVSGRGSVDQATITGESLPVSKEKGDPLFAATINLDGVLRVEVTKRAGETTLAKIIKLVEEAQSEKAETQRFLDCFEPKYAAGVILSVILLIIIPVFLFSQPFEPVFYRAMTLLVVASPCALIISTPSSILSGIARSAQGGVLFKGGAYLEQAGLINTIAFDKTGTLTTGQPTVTDLICFQSSGMRESELLHYAASAEEHSEHHIAKAIIKRAKADSISYGGAGNVKAIFGKGVVAIVDGHKVAVGNRKLIEVEEQFLTDEEKSKISIIEESGKTVIFVTIDDKPVGVIAIADELKKGAAEAIQALREMGIKDFAIVTGDTDNVANHIAGRLGIDHVYANLLPDEKVDVIRKLSEKKQVAMVGDGVNDAPALAVSNLGIAMGAAGTDVALETADVVLMADDLQRIPWLIKLARRSKTIVWQNITFSLAVIVLLIGSVFLFEMPLTLGVLAHEGSTILVVLNGLRLLQKG